MQALVQIGSSQYLVSEGQELLVDRPTIDSILLIIDGDKTIVGTPSVTDAHVAVKMLGEAKGEKVRAATYKAKSRYRKVRGFRAQYAKILIESISMGGEPKAKKEVAAEKPAVEKAPKKAASTKSRETKS